jgi:fatty-acyl-CoA synthase
MTKQDTPWVDGRTFAQVLSRTARRHGHRDALVFPQLGLRWTYREFEARVRTTARALAAIGCTKGSHVGIWSTNWPEWVLAQFGTAMIGAVLVNVNPAYRKHELAYILHQANLSGLIITDSHKTSDYAEMLAQLIPELSTERATHSIANPEFPELQFVVSVKRASAHPGIRSWPAFIDLAARVSNDRLDSISGQVGPLDPVNIQYTSGTTGDPKGAMLSHRNLLMNAWYVGQRQHITEQDRVCIPVPFYHCFGCVMGTLMCAVYGAAMVIPAESFEPVATMQAVTTERCTALYGVPTMFGAQVHEPSFGDYRFDSLRTGIMAGSPCPVELMKQVTSDMNLREMTIAYGQTEASPVITQSEITDSLETRVSTVGSAIPGMEVRLVDPESGEDVPQGAQGELWARGHGVMLGYYNMAQATDRTITQDGWLKTGDLATRTADGFYRITGRMKDMIIRGGENIYPREIEEFLLTHPDIIEVQVAGLPDARFGEQVCAWIRLRDGSSLDEQEVRAFCKDRIAHYKVPYYIVFVDEYPLTVTGKIQKFRLREQGIETFGLQEAAATRTA